MKYIKNIAMLMMAFCAVLAVSCSDDETTDSGVADRLFRPVGITLTPRGTSLTATWAGINGSVGYWVELFTEDDATSTGDGVTSDGVFDHGTVLKLVASNEMVKGTEWTVNGLDYNTTYYFRVKSLHADMTQNSYFTDFYSVKVPGMTEVLSCEVVDPIIPIVNFSWMEGYGIQFVKITAPDGGVRTVYVDDADGGFTMSDFVSGTYTAVAGNADATYNTVEFLIPVLYDLDASQITFDGVKFEWRVDPDLQKLICTNTANAADAVEFVLTRDQINAATFDYAMSEGKLKFDTTYEAVLVYADGSLSNKVSFTTMVEKPQGVVIVSTIEELVAAIAGSDAVIAIQPGDYEAEGNIEIMRAVTLMAATRQMPHVVVNQFTVKPSSYVDGTIRFDGIEFQCKSLNNETSCFIDTSDIKASVHRVEVENCYIHDFGSSFMRVNRVAGVVFEQILVNNNRLYTMYGQNSLINLSPTNALPVQSVTFTNNTMTGLCAHNRENRFIQYTADNDTRIVVSNNTFVDYHNKGRAFFFVTKHADAETAGAISIRNNIFYTEESDNCNASNFASTTITATIENNVVTRGWGDGSDAGTPAENKLGSWGDKYFELDPAFKAAGKFDFTVTNDEVKKLGVGDPRWLK